MDHLNKLLGGVLLIAGTTIGAGMLALPISTGIAGFVPALALFLVYWIYMTYTAFLFLEVNLWMEGDVNLVTMAEKTIGSLGRIASWFFYMFLLYALMTAYIAGGGPLFLDFMSRITGVAMPGWLGPFPLLLLFGYFVYRGTRYVDVINRMMMTGLAIAYFFIVYNLIPEIHPSYLEYSEWRYLPLSISLVATSFGFHIIIPSLTTYLKRDVKKLKLIILVGSCIPVLVYIIWNVVSLGIIPVDGNNGIHQAFVSGTDSTQLIANATEKTYLVSASTRFLSFFCIVTSFLGVSLSLFDFLADGVGIEKNRSGRLLLIALSFLPPLIIYFQFSRVFFTALEYAGAFGVITLLGILPALMVWWGRYHRGFDSSKFQVPGGKPALIGIVVFSILIISVEIATKLHWIQL